VRSSSGENAQNSQSSHGNLHSQEEITRSIDNKGVQSSAKTGLASYKSSQYRHMYESKSNSLHERKF